MNEQIEKMIADWDKNFKVLVESDRVAKEQGILVGRYVSEPFADGKAYYKIVSESKTKVKIEVVTGIGDDWILPYWGSKTSISKAYAKRQIEGREALEKLFSRKSSV